MPKMDIYITKVNEIQLRKEKSMSGLINRLLAEYYLKEDQDVREVAKRLSKQVQKNS